MMILKTITLLILSCSLQTNSQEIKHINCTEVCEPKNQEYCSLNQCSVNPCVEGCQNSEIGFINGCKDVCQHVKWLSDRESCLRGCHQGALKILDLLQTQFALSPPTIVVTSVTSTSITVEVNCPRKNCEDCDYVAQGHLYLQGKVVKSEGWKGFGGSLSCDFGQNGRLSKDVSVDDLVPYEEYHFRTFWNFSKEFPEGYTSNVSLSKRTKAEGLPDEPVILRMKQVNNLHISIEWSKPLVTRGPILSYVLQIKDINKENGWSLFKEIKVKKKNKVELLYITGPLEYGTEYNVTISAVNLEGKGPVAHSSLKTSLAPQYDMASIPYIYFCNEKTIYRKLLLQHHLYDNYNTVETFSKNLISLTFHYARKELYVLDEGGSLFKGAITENSGGFENIGSTGGPSKHIAVDWLNDKLFVVNITKDEKWQMQTCDLDGTNCHSLISRSGPIQHFQVDPYNGFLYWIETNTDGDSNLLQWDWECTSPKEPVVILTRTSLGSFVVVHDLGEILIPDKDQNEMLRVTLGEEIKILVTRDNYVGSSKTFYEIDHLFSLKNQLYWISKDGLNIEHKHTNNEYSSQLVTEKIPLQSPILVHSSLQPVPIPVNHVENVQVLYGFNEDGHQEGIITWDDPMTHLSRATFGTGCGAWHSWQYRVKINNDGGTKVTNATQLTFSANPKSVYSVSVQAFSDGGSSDWSRTFTARSYDDDQLYEKLYWSTGDQSVESGLHGSQMKNFKTTGLLAMSAYENTFMYSNQSGLYDADNEQLLSLKGVTDITFEPLGQAVYLTRRQHHEVVRIHTTSDFNTVISSEVLPFSSPLAHTAIDSILAKICWIELLYKIVCADFDGQDLMVVHQIDWWANTIFLGLAIDGASHHLYYLQQKSESGQHRIHEICRIDLQSGKRVMVESFEGQLYSGTLRFLDKKLFWLQNQTDIVVYDLNSKNLGIINIGMTIKHLAMSQTSVKVPNFEDVNDVNVIPKSVSKGSIDILKRQDDEFWLTWEKIHNVNFGSVLYDVILSYDPKVRPPTTLTKPHQNMSTVTIPTTTNDTTIDTSFLPPYSKTKVAIVARTKWGKSPEVSATVVTPGRLPASPQFLQAYVSPAGVATNDIEIEVRWILPEKNLGPLSHQEMSITCDTPHCPRHFTIHRDKRGLDFVVKVIERPKVMTLSLVTVNAFGKSEPAVLNYEIQSVFNTIPRVVSIMQDGLFVTEMLKGNGTSLTQSSQTVFEFTYGLKLSNLFTIIPSKNLYLTSMQSKSDANYELEVWNDTVRLGVTTVKDGFRPVTPPEFDEIGRWLYLFSTNQQNGITRLQRISMDDPEFKVMTIAELNKIIDNFKIQPMTQMLLVTVSRSQELVRFQLTQDGSLIEVTEGNCNCTKLHMQNDKIYTSFFLLKGSTYYRPDDTFCQCLPVNMPLLDQRNLEVLGEDLTHLYLRNHSSGNLTFMNKRNGQKLTTKDTNGIPYCKICTWLEPNLRNCLSPVSTTNSLQFSNVTDVSVIIKLPKIERHQDCLTKNMSLPPTTFTVIYMTVEDQQNQTDNTDMITLCQQEETHCLATQKTVFETHDDNHILLTGLQPFKRYSAMMELTNVYTDDIKDSQSPVTIVGSFKTLEGRPSSPRNVSAVTLGPDSMMILWLPPKEPNAMVVNYEIHYQHEKYVPLVKMFPNRARSQNLNVFRNVTLTDLEYDTIYKIWVVGRTTHEISSKSASISARTFHKVNQPFVGERFPRNVTMTWVAPVDKEIKHHQVLYFPRDDVSKLETLGNHQTETVPGQRYLLELVDLWPGTEYVVKVNLTYRLQNFPGSENPKESTYTWPKTNAALFATPKDKPLTPGPPYLTAQDGQTLLTWNEREDYLEFYQLQMQFVAPQNGSTDVMEPISSWQVVYSDRENQWPISGINIQNDSLVTFKVRAKNRFGYSNYSAPSRPIDLSEAVSSAYTSSIGSMIGIAIAVIVIFCLVVFAFIVILLRRPWDEKKHFKGYPGHNAIEMMSSTLSRITPSLQPNPIYTVQLPPEGDIEGLPKVNRDEIVLIRKIGSGAFGEVHEGITSGPNGIIAHHKVAIKTLRVGASDVSPAEFLHEAQLMYKLKHEHIVGLLGICLDNSNLFLVMELMEGGDLKNYLRKSQTDRNFALSMGDLIDMGTDVAKGCEYLEKQNFVHRDIAARNCLVTSHDPANRKVKISDFGLSRDVYKNNYYRKRGNGPVPIRWMAPESLLQGVFTSKSDVWSFGVLMWEVMTQGEEPYPNRSSEEVQYYVRTGGQLEVPRHCPEVVSKLMLRCWSFKADERPSFHECLNELNELMVYQNELHSIMAFGPNNPNPNSITEQIGTCSLSIGPASQATTVAMDDRSNIRLVSSFGALSTPSYLQLLHERQSMASLTSGVTNNSEHCHCDGVSTFGVPYSKIDHSCGSISNTAA